MDARVVVLSSCYAVAIAAGWVSFCLRHSVVASLLRTCRFLRASLQSYATKGTKQPCRPEVDLRFQELRARGCDIFAQGLCLVFSAWKAQILMTLLRGLDKWTTFEQDVILIVFSLALSIWISCKPLRKATPVDVVVVGAMLVLIMGALPFFMKAQPITTIVVLSRLCRSLCSIFFMDVRKAVFWNFGYNAVLFWSVASLDTALTKVTLREVVVREAMFMGVNVLIVSGFVRVITFQIIRELDVELSVVKYSAGHALLSTLCDVLVELDRDLKFTTPAWKFGAILLFNERRSLEGVEFKSLLSSQADQERFEQLVSAASNESPPRAVVFNVTMRDSNATNLTMEIFAVPFHLPVGGKSYLVGTREISDVEPTTLPSRTPPVVEAQSVLPSTRMDELFTQSFASCNVTANLSDCGRSGRRSESIKSSSASSGSSGRRRRKEFSLMMPALKETSIEGKMNSIVSLAHSWNSRLEKVRCCDLHGVVMDISLALKSFARVECDAEFCPHSGFQCQKCGIISLDVVTDDLCDMCCEDEPEQIVDELSARALSL